MGDCDPGLRCRRTITVTEQDTAIAIGSGDVPVLATPRVLAEAEAACVEAIAKDLPDGQTSVGAYAEVHHDKASPVGSEVQVEATLIGHHSRRLEFNVTFKEGEDIVARVQHRRVLVDRRRFVDKLNGAVARSA